jgi:hypothetical protein
MQAGVWRFAPRATCIVSDHHIWLSYTVQDIRNKIKRTDHLSLKTSRRPSHHRRHLPRPRNGVHKGLGRACITGTIRTRRCTLGRGPLLGGHRPVESALRGHQSRLQTREDRRVKHGDADARSGVLRAGGGRNATRGLHLRFQ